MKWVGLFVIALVGLTTIKDLWDLFGDLEMPVVREYSLHYYESLVHCSHVIYLLYCAWAMTT